MSRTRKRPTLTLGLVGLALVVAIISFSQSAVLAASARPTPLTMPEWNTAVADLSHPGAGCFRASYPVVEWRATRCEAAPKIPVEPRNPALSHMPQTVGAGSNDYSAYVPGLITQVYGSFTNVSSGISEQGQVGGKGSQVANAFSLQLNTQTFDTSACDGTGNSNGIGPNGCQGWEQFVYLTNPNELFIQYWLENYDATCPNGYQPFSFKNSSAIYCYMTTPTTPYPGGALTAADLATVHLTGYATAGGNDGVEVSLGSGQATLVSNSDSVLGLASVWNTAQWGVYGDAGQAEANFSSGSSLQTLMQVDGSSSGAPTCENQGFTGESNNMNRTATPAISTSPALSYPEMASKQAVGGTGTASCANAPAALNSYGHIVYQASNGTDDLYQTADASPYLWSGGSSRIKGQLSSDAPAVVKFGKEFVMAYTSSNSTHDIYVSTSSDGQNWTAGTKVKGQTTDVSPALADYRGQLVMAYLAANGTGDVIVTSTTTPLSWTNNSHTIDQESPNPPALAVYGGDLVMAFELDNGSDDIGVTQTTDPSNWGTQGAYLEGQSTDDSPALAVYGGDLVMAYLANDGNGDIYVTTASNPLSWSNNGYAIPQQSPNPPSMVSWDGNLVMALQFNNGSNDIGITLTQDPSNWGTAATTVPDQLTPNTPVLF
jgi:hypothetical protein